LALPFFFLFSGYFFTRSILKGKPVGALFANFCKRLIPVFFCYQILYALIPKSGASFLKDVTLYGWLKSYYWYFLDLNQHPVYLILLGVKYHLWFLPALFIGLGVVALFYRYRKEIFMIPMVFVIYFGMFMIKIYADYCHLPSDTLNIVLGIISAITYCSCGSMIARYSWPQKIALSLISFGVFLMALQSYFMYINHFDITWVDLVGRLPTSAGVFMLALLYPEWGKGTFFPKLGVVTLWIYGLHPFVLDQLYPLKQYINPVIWNITFPLVVYLICIAVVLGINFIIKRGQVAKNTFAITAQ